MGRLPGKCGPNEAAKADALSVGIGLRSASSVTVFFRVGRRWLVVAFEIEETPGLGWILDNMGLAAYLSLL